MAHVLLTASLLGCNHFRLVTSFRHGWRLLAVTANHWWHMLRHSRCILQWRLCAVSCICTVAQLRSMFRSEHVCTQIWQAWGSTAPVCPQLYLYSSADALIPPSEVQKFQKSQQARGVKIRSRMWEDSAHCEHYRIHPDEYVDQLQQFVHSCC